MSKDNDKKISREALKYLKRRYPEYKTLWYKIVNIFRARSKKNNMNKIKVIIMLCSLLSVVTILSCSSIYEESKPPLDKVIVPEDLPPEPKLVFEKPEDVGAVYDRFGRLMVYDYPTLSDSLIDKLRTQNFVVRYFAAVKVDPQYPKYISELFFVFDRLGETYKYDECHRVDLLLNGQPLSLPEPEHIIQYGEKLILERVAIPLTKRHVQKIAFAGTVEYRLCNDVGEFSKEDLDAWFYLWTQIEDIEYN